MLPHTSLGLGPAEDTARHVSRSTRRSPDANEPGQAALRTTRGRGGSVAKDDGACGGFGRKLSRERGLGGAAQVGAERQRQCGHRRRIERREVSRERLARRRYGGQNDGRRPGGLARYDAATRPRTKHAAGRGRRRAVAAAARLRPGRVLLHAAEHAACLRGRRLREKNRPEGDSGCPASGVHVTSRYTLRPGGSPWFYRQPPRNTFGAPASRPTSIAWIGADL